MISAFGLALFLWMQAAPPPDSPTWTWTLYNNGGPLVLANEVPDTPHLRSTLECTAGSSIVQLTLYNTPPAEGFASITSGTARASAEILQRPGRLQTMLRADHPVFAAFLAIGKVSVTAGETTSMVEIDGANLSKLRRFAELCTG